MKNILHIFRDDIKGLVKNILALIIAIGLCFIPSLYAWFNIYSNWDPYGNTGNVPIAVATEDKGYVKDDGTSINLGNDIIDKLADNTKLGWKIVETAEEAVAGVSSGKYYAAIVIEDDFSQKMYDCLRNGLEHPVLKYYENEKKNAIAVKITDSGAGSLQQEVNNEIIDEIVTTLSENISELTDDDSSVDKLIDDLKSVNDNLKSYDALLDSFMSCNTDISDTVLDIKDIIPKVNDVVNKSVNSLTTSADRISNAAKSINNSTAGIASNVINTKMNTLTVAITAANNSINAAQAALKNGEKPSVIADNLREAAENLGVVSGSVSDISSELDKLKGFGSDAGIQALQQSLQNVSNAAARCQKAVNSAADRVDTIHNTAEAISDFNRNILSTVIDQAVANLPELNSEISSDLTQKVNEIAGKANNAVDDVSSTVNDTAEGLNNIKTDISGLGTVLDGVSASLLAGNAALANSKVILRNTTQSLTEIIDKLDGVSDKDFYKTLQEILTNSPSLYGEFLSQPVNVTTVPVYETANYGSAVAPFYTTLAMWVGATILVALVKVSARPGNDYADAKDYELFFGRYILFFLMGQLQSFICVFGDIHILKVQCLEPGKLYLASALASFAFTFLIYSLTLSFGDIGKAFAVVIMIIQIAGSSGTYPIELLPTVFQAIYRYFPFPYAINAMRETISGMHGNDYYIYLAQLMVFALIALAIGLVIRKPFMELNHFIEKRMEDTKMM